MVKDIDFKKLAEILEKERESWEIIDVREPFEWNEKHIEGAKLIPIGEIVKRENEIDWSKKVLFYCQSGNRSWQIASIFSQKGKNVWNLEGGILNLEKDFKYFIK